MKKIFLLLLFISLGASSYSQSLVVHTKSGSPVSYSLSLIDSITFTLIPQEILFFDDFESGSISGYSVPSGHTPPVLTDIAYFSATNSISIKVPRNNYSMMGRSLSPAVTENIIGYNGKMMKSNLSDKGCMTIMLFSGTVGPAKELVLGFYRDSICVAIQNNSDPSQNVFTMVGVIEANRWYDFNIEYNFTTNKASFYIDGNKVFESNYTAPSIDYFYLGDFNTDITPILDKVMFIDDIKVYKR